MDKIVETKSSLIAGTGMGLFAKKNTKSGTIDSFYPVHAIGVIFGDSSICLSSSDVRQGYFRRDANNDTNDSKDSDWNGNYLQYIIGSCPLAGLCVSKVFGSDALFVDVEPSQVDCVGWKGHYVNDGAIRQWEALLGLAPSALTFLLYVGDAF